MTWTVTDAAGNSATCQQTVTVNDVDDPSITCPDDVVTSNDQGRCDATVEIGSPTVADNCGVTTPTAVRSDGPHACRSVPGGDDCCDVDGYRTRPATARPASIR